MINYSYDHLRNDVTQGHEVSFFFNSNRYSISRGENGEWYLAKSNDPNYQIFNSPEDLLSNATVDGNTLQTIWDQVEVDVIF